MRKENIEIKFFPSFFFAINFCKIWYSNSKLQKATQIHDSQCLIRIIPFICTVRLLQLRIERNICFFTVRRFYVWNLYVRRER